MYEPLDAPTSWTIAAVRKLQELWPNGTPVALIATILGRPEAEIRSKAVELKLRAPPR